ncbi:MAG TPA: MFS transporter [Anaerolineales bacterium]|jgi:FHS family Na+ dependent glucose MFS transporter 1|nr:MFS transporter [Anaerolineales bacterium]
MNQKYASTTAYYLAFILLGLMIAAEGPTLLKLAEHTSSKLNQISSLFLFGSLGYLLGSYIGGRLYDRVPGHPFMAGVLLFVGITIALIPLASSRWVLFTVALFSGLFKGALDVGCNTLLLWVHSEGIGPFMNGLHAFFGVGAFISPLVVAQVLSLTGDIGWVYWLFAIACFPLAIWVWMLPSPLSRAVPAHHEHAPFPILPVLIMVFCFVLYIGGEAGYGAWIYTYAFTLNFGTEVTAAYLTSAFWGSFTLGRLFGIWFSTRARPITILLLDFAGCLLSVGLILLSPQSRFMLWLGTILFGISQASIFPTFLTLAEERMHVTGTIAGLFLVGAGVGGMILPWLIGQAFVQVGAGAMMSMIFTGIVLNLLMLLLFTRISLNSSSISESTAVAD